MQCSTSVGRVRRRRHSTDARLFPIFFRTDRDESGLDDFRIRSDPNPNYANMENIFDIHVDVDNLNPCADAD
jgi:hypothetical protein